MISFVGVIVFTGLAAYDAQRMKSMALALPTGQTGSYAIVGALALYLDFINLFLSAAAVYRQSARLDRHPSATTAAATDPRRSLFQIRPGQPADAAAF